MNVKLSPTELRIIRLIGSGDMPRDVAVKLNRSPNTISTHLIRIKRKLGAKSTIQAAIMWATQINAGDMEYLSWGRPAK